MIKKIGLTIVSLIVLSSTLYAESVQSEIKALKKRLEQLEKKLTTEQEKQAALTREVEKSKLNQFLPEKAELKSQWGLGPAASSVYKVGKGVSIGGYGEATYRNFVDDDEGKQDQADFLRFVGYLGYKFNDWLIFNSEIEFEHGTTSGIGDSSGEKEGSVSVELAYLDFMYQPEFNARAGLLLVPMGFINEIHEPPYYHGVRRPEVEQRIIPTTWRELGLGAFGKIGDQFEYRTYLINGLRARRFSDGGIRSGRQKGNRAITEGLAWVTRLDYSPNWLPGGLIGGSFYIGDSGQDDDFAGSKPDVRTTMWEAHAEYKNRGFEFRALGAMLDIDDTEIISAALGETIGEEQSGWYAEAAYNVLPLFGHTGEQYLAPFFRYESFDTHAEVASGLTADPSLDKEVRTVGITYKPIPQVALKLDYRNFDTDGPKPTADEVALGIGFAF